MDVKLKKKIILCVKEKETFWQTLNRLFQMRLAFFLSIKLKSLTISHLGPIKGTKRIKFGKLNLIVGKNGKGKTRIVNSIIDALCIPRLFFPLSLESKIALEVYPKTKYAINGAMDKRLEHIKCIIIDEAFSVFDKSWRINLIKFFRKLNIQLIITDLRANKDIYRDFKVTQL